MSGRRPRIVASSLALLALLAPANAAPEEQGQEPVTDGLPGPVVAPEPPPVVEASSEPVSPPTTALQQKAPAPLCLCGCLVQTSSVRRLFRQGHDARLVGFVARGKLADGSEPSPEQTAAANQIRSAKAWTAARRLPPVLEAATQEEISATEQAGEAAASNVG